MGDFLMQCKVINLFLYVKVGFTFSSYTYFKKKNCDYYKYDLIITLQWSHACDGYIINLPKIEISWFENLDFI